MSTVDANETLARYLFEKNKFAASKGRVKPGAFFPAPNLTTSVYRTLGIPAAEIWSIGDGVAAQRSMTLLARADIEAGAVVQAGLRVEPSEPPFRHANILGWPSEKERQLLLATMLAYQARLLVKPK